MACGELVSLLACNRIVKSNYAVVLSGAEKVPVQIGERNLVDAGIIRAQLSNFRYIVRCGRCLIPLINQVLHRVETDAAFLVRSCQECVLAIKAD